LSDDLKAKIYGWLRAGKRMLVRHTRWPPMGAVDFGDLRRLTPISQNFGFDRGQPVDRYYIEKFLGRHAADIQGHVLEIGDPRYTRQFGGERVTHSDVLHINLQWPEVTIIADLTDAPQLPADRFDCFIMTQTLHVIYDFRAAIRTAYRILKPGGVLLATLPGITRVYFSTPSEGDYQDYWRFTSLAAEQVFSEIFPPSHITVQGYGNLLAAVAFLYGLASAELSPEELDHLDRTYEVSVCVRAVKPLN
jgi:SAM-dependent methyltransferase